MPRLPGHKQPPSGGDPANETSGDGPPSVGGSARFEFRTFDSAIEFLLSRVNVERSAPTAVDPHVFKLERMRALVESLGNPQDTYKTIHVTGSKGKGSVCEMTASSLQACGLTTGIFTSPHLVDIRERIRIDGEMISHEDFRLLTGRVATAAASLVPAHGECTYFELLTAMGFLHFAEQAVDIAVIEVGLGGRLDSTNVITPLVSAITAIQLEHVDLLGNTLAAIAREKAGIIKPGVPMLTIAKQDASVVGVLREVAAACKSPLRVVGEDIDFSCRVGHCPELGQHARVCLTTPAGGVYEHLPVPLKGEHQAYNCGLALAIIDEVRATGLRISERDVAIGLARTPNHGRLELVHSEPRIFVDGAHNPDSVGALMRAVGSHLRYDSLVIIFGCAKDKDVSGMLGRLATGADKVIFTKASNNPRAAEPRDLLRKFNEISGKVAQIAPDVKEAINIAHRAVHRDDVICVTGSFYIAGEAKRLLQSKFGPCSGNCSGSGPVVPPSVAVRPLPEPKPEQKAEPKDRHKPSG